MRTLNKKTLIFSTALLLLFIACKEVCFDVGKRGVVTNIDGAKKRNVFVCEYKASKDTVTIAGETFVLGDAWVEYPWIKKNCEGDIEIQKHAYRFHANTYNSITNERVWPELYLDNNLSVDFYPDNYLGISAISVSYSVKEVKVPPDTITMKYKERINGKEGSVYFVKQH